jgi:hypothetical protein
MDTDSYPYVKLREEFGKPVNFKNLKETLNTGYLPNHLGDKERGFSSDEVHVKRNPNFKTFSNIPQMSENTVTELYFTNALGQHRESKHKR